MVRAADTVFSLEVATQDSPQRLLEPLARVPDKAPPPAEPASEEYVSPPAPEMPSDATAAVDDAAATVAPASSPMTELPSAPPEAPMRKVSRDPTFVIVVVAIVLGIAGVAALFALFLW